MSAFLIDAFEFCRRKERRGGEIAISDSPRLAKESADTSGVLRWSLAGDRNALGHPQLGLKVSGSVKLICQRCLRPFDFEIDSDSVLVLASDEAAADEIEELLNDESVDVIVGSSTMDLIGLIEDEALLALPVSPKHDFCPEAAPAESIKLPEKESPFAVLKNLKRD
ncbi:MAG: YceD family protein [Burkholderiaceae bacterium]